MNLIEIQNRNYQATVKRGLITPKTTESEFIAKLFEEVRELDNSRRFFGKFDPYELADVMIVCLSIAKHYDVDIIKSLEDKTIINEKRAL
jgi:hypothetical protein